MPLLQSKFLHSFQHNRFWRKRMVKTVLLLRPQTGPADIHLTGTLPPILQQLAYKICKTLEQHSRKRNDKNCLSSARID